MKTAKIDIYFAAWFVCFVLLCFVKSNTKMGQTCDWRCGFKGRFNKPEHITFS